MTSRLKNIFHSILLVCSCSPLAWSQESTKAVTSANRAFAIPETTAPSMDEKTFAYTEVGAKIPNYTAGQRWGTQGELITKMQNPVPAEVSIQAYSVPKNFSLSLWAKESNENWPEAVRGDDKIAGLMGKPIAMNWDERGRLYVCETTLYLKDTDGDDVADFRQVLITGWALGDTHGGVSNFQYGPDNWIWGMQGYNNSEPIVNGKPQMRFRQGFWRFKVRAGAADSTAPAFAIDMATKQAAKDATDKFNKDTIRVDALEFMRATNNNTWGLGFSEEGYVFGSTANNCPSVHMPIANRFYDQVAGWSPKTLEKISPDAKFKPLDDQIRQVDVHGGYTAAAGHALYTARNYPESWWNRIAMVCEPTGHLVASFVLEKSGAGYKSNNSFNTIASIDDWAAPIMSEVD